jgi:hypothetical protein
MTDTPDSRPSFWTTLPGVLTAIAALITAAAGLYAVLHRSEPAVSSSLRTTSSSTSSSLPARSAADSVQVAPRTPSTTNTLPSKYRPTAGATTATAASDPLAPYEATDYSAEIPAGWSQVETETQRPSETESRWQAPGQNDEYLLIDTHKRTHLTPEQDAQPVHADLEKADGYQEIYYGPGNLGGITSWMWVFDAEGSERIDYFFETCRKTMAVLGSTEPDHFDRSRPTFRAVAQSVRARCN